MFFYDHKNQRASLVGRDFAGTNLGIIAKVINYTLKPQINKDQYADGVEVEAMLAAPFNISVYPDPDPYTGSFGASTGTVKKLKIMSPSKIQSDNIAADYDSLFGSYRKGLDIIVRYDAGRSFHPLDKFTYDSKVYQILTLRKSLDLEQVFIESKYLSG